MIRPRGGATRRRDDQDEDRTAPAAEIGRMLRDAREERGLDLLAVHDRLGRPITQLEALERGDLAGLPDQALALSTLRRYAALLGLDGDALALRLIDEWPVAPASGNGSKGADATTGVVTSVSSGPEHLRAFTQTGPVPRVGGKVSGAVAGLPTGPPTGTFPVVPREELRRSKRALARSRRRLRAPAWLKVATFLAGVLLVAVIAGLVVLQQRPQWMVSAHLLRIAPVGGTPAKTPTTTTPVARHQVAPVVPTGSTGANATSYTVNVTPFAVNVTTTGPCWVQVTSSASPVPLVSAVEPAGRHLSYPAHGTMTVQVGSSSVVVGISTHGHVVFYNAPTAVPFTYVFTPAGG